ncbi:MAG TPA: polyamine aminopropyltransferase [Candidatus Gastranaerophilales bacterium]|nr:polyamine aminopropyltransferase [Candidatus Gastranaerophilales bacterium]
MTLDIWFTEKHKDQQGISVKVKNVLYSGQSDFQKIDVIDTEAFGKVLLLDELFMTTEKDEFFYHEMISHIPLLAHRCPERVLVIGGGDGGTIREVLNHPSVKEVVLCEIDKAVIDVSIKYFPSIACRLDDPRVKINIEDAVEYIKKQKNSFDVVLIDSTDPLGPGVGLFTEDFYTNVKNSLKEGGVMAAQTESPIACQKEFQLINALLNKVFSVVKPYFAPVPTYPGAYWSWTFCSMGVLPEINNENLAIELEKTAIYYNREIHKAVFAIPNYVKRLIENKDTVIPGCN